MRKILLIFLLLFSLGLVGCDEEKSHEAQNIIIIGHSDSETNLIHISLLHFAEAVEKRTQGALKVKIFPAEQLGNDTEMFQMVEKGTLDGMMLPASQQATICPKFKTLSLPFLFSSYLHVYKVLDGPIGNELPEGLNKHNMIQLAYWANGLRQITNNKHPINEPKDLQALKICTPEDEITIEIFKTFGAKPSPYSLSKLYLAVKQGLYDGIENSVANIYAYNLHEVQKYLSMVNYQYQPRTMVLSLSRWESLPVNVQDILLKAAKEFGKEHREAVTSNEAQMLVDFGDQGIEIDYPYPEPFEAASEPVYQHFYKNNDWAEDLVKRIKALR